MAGAGGQTAGRKDLCSTSLEPAFYGQQQKSDINQKLATETVPHEINEPKND